MSISPANRNWHQLGFGIGCRPWGRHAQHGGGDWHWNGLGCCHRHWIHKNELQTLIDFKLGDYRKMITFIEFILAGFVGWIVSVVFLDYYEYERPQNRTENSD